jgi:hypothetical protein
MFGSQDQRKMLIYRGEGPHGDVLKKRQAIEKLGIHVPSFSRALVEDLIRTAESREKPAMPPRILTARQEMVLMASQGSRDLQNN